MSKLNGNFISLHRISKLKWPPAQYYNTLEFERHLGLEDCFGEGCAASSATYKLNNQPEVERRLRESGALNELFFVESNSAHHISRFIAKAAYDEYVNVMRATNPKFLIVNFDQHDDYGVKKEDKDLFCGNWGAYISAEIRCDYLVIGRKFEKGILYCPYNKDKETYSLADDVDKLNELYASYDKIYVTVDMDVLNSAPFVPKETAAKRTNWGHGDMNIDMLEGLITQIPVNKIIAADITGFPPIPQSGMENQADSYISDIVRIAMAVSERMKKPLYMS